MPSKDGRLALERAAETGRCSSTRRGPKPSEANGVGAGKNVGQERGPFLAETLGLRGRCLLAGHREGQAHGGEELLAIRGLARNFLGRLGRSNLLAGGDRGALVASGLRLGLGLGGSNLGGAGDRGVLVLGLVN